MKIKMLSLFSGIGAFESALRNLGIDYDLINFSEIDKFAIKSYCAIHEESEDKNLGDISEIDPSILPHDIDLVTHGSPCQSYSISGDCTGGDKGSGTESSLMWHTVDIVKTILPKVVIWENVKNVLSKRHKHNFDLYINDLNDAGYNSYYEVLNAKDYGVPQNRERIFVVSIRKDVDTGEFEFPKFIKLNLRLKDILEDNADSKYDLKFINDFTYYDKKIVDEPRCIEIGNLNHYGNDQMNRVYSVEGLAPTVMTKTGGGRETKIDDNGRLRRMTPRENWRLMGFSDAEFEIAAGINSATQLYHQAGNSIVVNVLEEIFKELYIKGEFDGSK